ncbi:unnamed protein product, partial [Cladocopium goreaui]
EVSRYEMGNGALRCREAVTDNGASSSCSRCGARVSEEAVAELPIDDEESPSYAAQVPSTAPVASGIPSAAGLLAPPVEIRGPTVYELELAPKVEEITHHMVTML